MSVLSAIADGKDTMVEVAAACGSSDDSGGVLLEDGLVSFDGDRDWTDVELSLKSVRAFLLHISIG